MSKIKKKIELELLKAIDESGGNKTIEISESTVLLETGLDSLGFATLVATLEDTLGFDPFLQMKTPVYPKTFGEFVSIYEQNHST